MNLLDDLDDLSDEGPKTKQPANKKKPTAKKPVEEDGWGDLGLDDDPMPATQSKSNFGYGGPTGLRKEKVDKDDDEWGLLEAPPAK